MCVFLSARLTSSRKCPLIPRTVSVKWNPIIVFLLQRNKWHQYSCQDKFLSQQAKNGWTFFDFTRPTIFFLSLSRFFWTSTLERGETFDSTTFSINVVKRWNQVFLSVIRDHFYICVYVCVWYQILYIDVYVWTCACVCIYLNPPQPAGCGTRSNLSGVLLAFK